MKKIILITLITISYNTYAAECNLKNTTTLDEVESTQKCLIALLTDIESELKKYKNYKLEAVSRYEKLINHAGLCRSMELKNEAYKAKGENINKYIDINSETYKRCTNDYQKREDVHFKSSNDFSDLGEKIPDLKKIYQALLYEQKILNISKDLLKK